MRVVYVDVLFALNLCINYILLLLTAQCSGVYVRRRRILCGAALGALFAVLLYFPPMGTAASLLSKAGVCAAVTWVTFAREGRQALLKLCLRFVILSFCLAGGMVALSFLTQSGRASVQNGIPYADFSLWFLLCASVIVYLLLGLIFGQSGGALSTKTASSRLLLTHGGKTVQLRALRDTGNLLREPMSGKSIIVASAEQISPLFDTYEQQILGRLTAQNVFESYLSLSAQSRNVFRLTPYQNNDTNRAMMLTVKLDDITVDDAQNAQYLLGISPTRIETPDGCKAIMGV